MSEEELTELEKISFQLSKIYKARGKKALTKNYKYIQNPGKYVVADVGILPHYEIPKLLYIITDTMNVFLLPTTKNFIGWVQCMEEMLDDGVTIFPTEVEFDGDEITLHN